MEGEDLLEEWKRTTVLMVEGTLSSQLETHLEGEEKGWKGEGKPRPLRERGLAGGKGGRKEKSC